jgi:precorrin-6B methylase 2
MPTGLSGVNLEAPAKLLVPLLAPFRQSVARVVKPGRGTNWKTITGVTRGGTLKSADGVRSAGFTVSTGDGQATYAEYGKFGDITWAGDVAGANLEDLRARAETLCLLQLLRDEEAAMLGAATVALGAGPTPTLTTATTGGTIADGAVYVYLVPLSQPGVLGASRVARPISSNRYNFTTVPTLNLLDGVGLPTAANTTVTAAGGGTSTITINFTWAAGVTAYAVYAGTTSGSANARLQGIVSQSRIVMTAINTTGAAPPTSDTSANGPFLGMLGQLVASGSGAYVNKLSAPLSAAVGRGIPEIDAMLNDIYDRCKEDPDRLVMNWQEHQSIDDALAAVANDRIKFNISVSPSQSAEVMPRFTSYKSSRGKVITMEENPNLPGGAILALKDAVDIPNSDIANAWQMHMGKDLARLDYALTNPKYEFENRAYGALAGYAPAFQGVLYDVWKF